MATSPLGWNDLSAFWNAQRAIVRPPDPGTWSQNDGLTAPIAPIGDRFERGAQTGRRFHRHALGDASFQNSRALGDNPWNTELPFGMSQDDFDTLLAYLERFLSNSASSSAQQSGGGGGGGGGPVAPFNPRAPKINQAFPNLSLDPKSPDYENQLKQVIAGDIRTAYGREATDADYSYWLGKMEGPCDSSMVTSGQMSALEYWHQRLLGMGAGGSDVARFGPYAGGGG
jgi:hypothetical protein